MLDYGIFEKVDIHGAVPGFVIRHRRSDSKIVKSHWHPELELNVAFEGRSQFFINGRVEDLTPQHAVLVNSCEVHSSIPYFPAEGADITGVTLQISHSFLKSLVPDVEKRRFALTEAADKTVRGLVAQLNQWYQEEAHYVQVLTIRQICEIVYVLLAQCPWEPAAEGGGAADESFQKLEHVIAYIHSHYNQPLHTAQVAKDLYFSKEYFCRFFKKYTGMTFSQYLTKLRIIKAEQLLSQSSMKIAEIAQETGFSDEGSFIQAFRKYYGSTPGNYRKQLSQNPCFGRE